VRPPVLLPLLLCACLAPEPTPASLAAAEREEIFAACRRGVEKELVSPSSATFISIYGASDTAGVPAQPGQPIPPEPTPDRRLQQDVFGEVESSNRFGVMLRSSFHCRVWHDPQQGGWYAAEAGIMER
jgi:hypothetical protein